MKANNKVASLSPATQSNGTQKVVYTCQMVYDELVSVFGDDQVILLANWFSGVFIPYDRTDTLRPYQMAKKGFDNLLYSFSGQVSKNYSDNYVFLGHVEKQHNAKAISRYTDWFYGSFLIFASYDASKTDPVIHFIHSNMSGFGRVLLKSATNVRIRSYESVFDGYGASTTARGNLALGARNISPRIVLLGQDRVGDISEAYFTVGDASAINV